MTFAHLGTVLTAMVTPFGPDGEIDFDVAAQLARRLVEDAEHAWQISRTVAVEPSLEGDVEEG